MCNCGLLLITAALSLTGYNRWDNCRADAEAGSALKQLFPEMESDQIPAEEGLLCRKTRKNVILDEIEYPDYILNLDMPVKRINGNDYIGIISIPAIDRVLPILSEWSYQNLKITPCRYAGSAYLDNLVICAHNYRTHFGSLKNLHYGDMITFTDIDGNTFNYKVIEIDTLQPAAIDELTSGNRDLTLFTCTIGGATRVTVRCEKV